MSVTISPSVCGRPPLERAGDARRSVVEVAGRGEDARSRVSGRARPRPASTRLTVAVETFARRGDVADGRDHARRLRSACFAEDLRRSPGRSPIGTAGTSSPRASRSREHLEVGLELLELGAAAHHRVQLSALSSPRRYVPPDRPRVRIVNESPIGSACWTLWVMKIDAEAPCCGPRSRGAGRSPTP